MGKGVLGIIGGTLLPKTRLLEGAAEKAVKTPYGEANVMEGDNAVFIQRHGRGNVPPHMINHKANIWALSKLTDTIVGVGSTGSLKREIKPPSIVVPDDFIGFDPPTLFDSEIRHVTPGFDETLRNHIVDTASWHRIKVVPEGVYVQTRGPRLEMKAEVRMLAHYGDIVGMTIASEATLACELGLKYAAICSVDNLAHGLTKNRLDFLDVKDNALRNGANVERLLELLVGGAK
jgi:5'-methylthioadenosine phosphorylase